MAQKGYPTASYPQCYPPMGGPPPPAYSAPGTTVIVQQQRPVVVAARPNRGLLGQLGHEINMFGKSVSREADTAATIINKSLSTAATGSVLSLFQSGNVVMFLSRVSGRSLQVVQGPMGLAVDGCGAPEGEPFNAMWTVVNEGGNQVRLHNNNNFLAVINGSTILMNLPLGATHGLETKFQMTQLGQFISFESLKERGKHLGVLPTGQLKPAVATCKEDHSQFGIRLLRSPYGVHK